MISVIGLPIHIDWLAVAGAEVKSISQEATTQSTNKSKVVVSPHEPAEIVTTMVVLTFVV